VNGPDKIIIGIHGVGDQTNGTTIQAGRLEFGALKSEEDLT